MTKTPETKMSTRAAFMAAYANVYEHAPWAAEAAWSTLSPAATAAHITQALRDAVDAADDAAVHKLLNAYPELVTTPALSADSKTEHAAAGLDQCTAQQHQTFTDLNRAYREKFNFPFIIAVRGKSPQEILQTFTDRLNNPVAAERKTALAEIHKIAALRIAAL